MNYDYSKVPADLTSLDQWVCWGWRDKPLKMPISPTTGEGAKAGKPDTWTSFNQALSRVTLKRCRGVGFEFADNSDIVGIDLDTVRDPQTEEVAPEALEFIEKLNSYTEISPSGYGFHIFIRATIDLKAGNKFKLPENGIKRVYKNKSGKETPKEPELELYNAGRYFTMTGNVYGDAKPLRNAQTEIEALYIKYSKPKSTRKLWDVASGPIKGSYLETGLKRDKLFKELWNGARRIGNESADDQALMNKLAYWCSHDIDAMIAAFLDSPHAKQKDEEHWKKSAERKDYLLRTVHKAISDCPSTPQGITMNTIKSGRPAL